MNFDRFREPNTKDLKLFSRCMACNEPIYEGDEVVLHFGMVCCDKRSCILKATGSELIIAGEEVELE